MIVTYKIRLNAFLLDQNVNLIKLKSNNINFLDLTSFGFMRFHSSIGFGAPYNIVT